MTPVEELEVQPDEFVTVNVYVAEVSDVTVKLPPLPVYMTSPGDCVIVHPPPGNPFNLILPVATEQVGCVTVPIVGGDCTGGELITTPEVSDEVQPEDAATDQE